MRGAIAFAAVSERGASSSFPAESLQPAETHRRAFRSNCVVAVLPSGVFTSTEIGSLAMFLASYSSQTVWPSSVEGEFLVAAE